MRAHQVCEFWDERQDTWFSAKNFYAPLEKAMEKFDQLSVHIARAW